MRHKLSKFILDGLQLLYLFFWLLCLVCYLLELIFFVTRTTQFVLTEKPERFTYSEIMVLPG